MANSEKDIIIYPSRGSANVDPYIEFRSANANANVRIITLETAPASNGTINFKGNAGQLFSITNLLTGTLFSVNDISGIPSLEILDTGQVKIAPGIGNVLIGTSVDAGFKLDVNGNLRALNITGNLTSGNLLPNSGVVASTYGNSSIIPVLTIDSKGRITAASNVVVTGGGGGTTAACTIVSNATITPDVAVYGMYVVSSLSTNLTINATTVNNPANGSRLVFRIRDDGNVRTLTWSNSIPGGYRGVGVTLPANTSPTSNVVYVGCYYNQEENIWDVLAVNRLGT
jgi:hypothetical protein